MRDRGSTMLGSGPPGTKLCGLTRPSTPVPRELARAGCTISSLLCNRCVVEFAPRCEREPVTGLTGRLDKSLCELEPPAVDITGAALELARRFSADRLPFKLRFRSSVVAGRGAGVVELSCSSATPPGVPARGVLSPDAFKKLSELDAAIFCGLRSWTHHAPERQRETRRAVVGETSRISGLSTKPSSMRTSCGRLYGTSRSCVLVRRGCNTRKYVWRS